MPRISAIRWRIAWRWGEQLGPLGEDDAVEVDDPPARPRRPPRQAAASISAESRPRLAGSVSGNICADVAQRGRPQQGVGHGVQQHVGVAVADQAPDRAGCRSRPAAAARPAPADACRVRFQRVAAVRGSISLELRLRIFVNCPIAAGLYPPGRLPTTRADSGGIPAEAMTARQLSPRPPRRPYNRSSYGHHRDRRAGEVLPRLPEAGGTAGLDPRAVPPHVPRRSRPSAASTSRSSRASSSPFWAPTAPARPPRSSCSPA